MNMMMNAAAMLLLTTTAAMGQTGQHARVPNVQAQFGTLERFGDAMGFYIGTAPDPSQSKHWQGIARHPNPGSNVFYVSRNGENAAGRRANLAVVQMKSRDGLTGDRLRSNRLARGTETQDTAPPSNDAVVRNIEFTSHNHLGGIQISGDIMAVPLEDANGSNPTGVIQFYDIRDPLNPVLLPTTITRPHNVGVVGFTQLPDGRYLVLATYGNNAEIQYFLSAPNDLSSLSSTPTSTVQGSTIAGWFVGNNAGGVYCFQNCNFITQTDGTVFLACTLNSSPAAPVVNGLDIAVLFRVTVGASTVSLTQVSGRHFYCSSNSTGSNGNFNAAAGFYVSPSGELLLYSTTHDNDGPGDCVGMTEFRNYRGTRGGTAATACDAWVRLYADPSGWDSDDRGIMFDAVDRADEDWNNFNNLDGGPIPVGFTDQASSVSWLLPVGATARLWQNDSFGGKYRDLVGTGTVQFISDLSAVAWTSGSGDPDDQISSIQLLGSGVPGAAIRVPTSAASVTLGEALLTGGTCSRLLINAGYYPENVRFNAAGQIRPVGGSVIIGTNP